MLIATRPPSGYMTPSEPISTMRLAIGPPLGENRHNSKLSFTPDSYSKIAAAGSTVARSLQTLLPPAAETLWTRLPIIQFRASISWIPSSSSALPSVKVRYRQFVETPVFGSVYFQLFGFQSPRNRLPLTNSSFPIVPA